MLQDQMEKADGMDITCMHQTDSRTFRSSSPVVDTKPSRAELYASGHISQYIPTIRVFDADSTVDPPMDPVQAAPGDNVDLKSETPEQPRPALTGSMRNTFNPKTLLGVELEGARGNIVTG